MKSSEVLSWIVRCSINGEHLGFVDVPEEGEQNEEWWLDTMGGLPPSPIESGAYLYYYNSDHEKIEFNGKKWGTIEPDAEIELPTDDGFEYIYLYRIEDLELNFARTF